MEKIIVSTEHAPAAVGPYSQGMRVGNFLFTAGQIGLDPATGKLVEGGFAAQAEQVLQNLKAVVEAGGSTLNQVIKTTVFVEDMANFGTLNEIYARYFSEGKPARSTVSAKLPLGALVEIEAVALIPGPDAE